MRTKTGTEKAVTFQRRDLPSPMLLDGQSISVYCQPLAIACRAIE
jgi:hypothetical protein